MVRRSLLLVPGLLLLAVLSACGPLTSAGQPSPSINTTPISTTPTVQQTQPAQDHAITLGSCKKEAPAPVVSALAPGTQTIYVGSFDSLYAIHASNGVQAWCRQATVSGTFSCPDSCPAGPFLRFGRPLVANGVVYACVSGYGGYTYALRASDGTTLWRVKTDCEIADEPFEDYAMPLLSGNVVYSGTSALASQDGAIDWQTSRKVAFQRLVNGVLYASSQDAVEALNVRDGSLLWHYAVSGGEVIDGQLTVDGTQVYFGTDTALYALNASTGALLWRFTQGAYFDIHTLSNLVFVIGGDRHAIYALNSNDGTIRWSFRQTSFFYASSVDGQNTLFVSADGIYALRADSGSAIWHQALNANQSVDFTPVTEVSGVAYLGEVDGKSNSVLYALNASTGAEYWHLGQIRQVTPPTVQ